MDCPEIVSVLRDGYRRKYLVPHCPVCGCECERIAYSRNREAIGCEHCSRWLPPCCPVCGSECERIYSLDGEPVGCENCISWKDADIEEEEDYE